MKTLVCRECGMLVTTKAKRKALCGQCGAMNVVPQSEVETKPGPGGPVSGTAADAVADRLCFGRR